MTDNEANVHVDVQMLRKFIADHGAARLLKRYRAHAVGIGRKVTKGRETSLSACLRFYVEAKHNRGARSNIPAVIEVRDPARLVTRTFRTDVIECRPIGSHEDVSSVARLRHSQPPLPKPVRGGDSCSLLSTSNVSSFGTLGGFAWDTVERCIVLISNRHVLGSEQVEVASPGYGKWTPYQPTCIGKVLRASTGGPNRSDRIDCTIAKPGTGWVSLEVPGIGDAILATEPPTIGLQVRMRGATTPDSVGEIDDIDYQCWMGTEPERRWMYDCIRVKPLDGGRAFSDAGDSGSLLFSDATLADGSGIHPVVGLHFGGDPTSGTGLSCKIENVFADMKLESVPQGALRWCVETSLDLAGQRATNLARDSSTRTDADDSSIGHSGRRNEARATHQLEVFSALYAGAAAKSFIATAMRYRSHLASRLIFDDEVRRLAVEAMLPVVSVPVDDLLMDRVLETDDVRRLLLLADEMSRTAMPDAAASFENIRSVLAESAGKRFGDMLRATIAQ